MIKQYCQQKLKWLNGIEVLISKDLIESHVNHDELFLVDNVLKEFNDVKEEIKKLKISTVHQTF